MKEKVYTIPLSYILKDKNLRWEVAPLDEKDFEALAMLMKTKNITHAAERLYVSQSSLSKRISAIEQDLGITLMLRSRQGIHFTPEGEEVCRRTAEAANQLLLMREKLTSQKDYLTGTLRAGVSINYSMYKLPDVLTAFQGKHPHVHTHIATDHSRKVYLQLLEGTIDVAILRGEYPWQKNQILLSREPICAIASTEDKEHDFTEMTYIGRKTDSAFEKELARWLHENDVRPNEHGIVVDHIATCVEMVKRGLGWAIVPEICLQDFKGYVQPLHFQNGEPFVRSTYILYSDHALDLPQVKAFIDIVQELRDAEEKNE